MKSIQQFVDGLGEKSKTTAAALVLGAPGEICGLLDHLRFDATICYQMDLYPADHCAILSKEQSLQAEVVTVADASGTCRDLLAASFTLPWMPASVA